MILGELWTPVYFQIDLKDTTIQLSDGTTPTANTLDIKIGEGNLTYTESRTVEYVLDRGLLDEVRLGDEVPMDVTVDFIWEFLKSSSSSGATPTIEDALKNQGAASAWISTDADGCRPFALDLSIIHVPSCSTVADQETITLPDFRYDSLDHDLRAGTVAITGRCNALEATIARVAQP